MLDCVIRGLSPKPGAWFEHKGERIKILLADPVEGHGAPGEFLPDANIACGEGALRAGLECNVPDEAQRIGKAFCAVFHFSRAITSTDAALSPDHRI